MTRVTHAQACRRRTFTALMSVSVLALIVILWPKGQSDQLAAPSRTAPAASATGTVAPSSKPIPAWLAWKSGGFPPTFRDWIRGADGLTRTVVVAGVLPAKRVITTIYRGGYEGLGAAWGEFDGKVKAQGTKTTGEFWEIYETGPESGPDEAKWATRLAMVLA